MRGFGALGAVIFLVPAMVIGAMQMQMMFKVNKSMGEAFSAETGPDRIETAVAEESGEIAFRIVGSRGQDLEPKQAAALLAPATFTRERLAQLSTIIDPMSLLQPGETMPEGEMRDVLVEARIAKVADAACEHLVDTIAGNCGVIRYSTRMISHDAEQDPPELAGFDGYYRVETMAVFTPKDSVGSFPQTDTVVYQEREFNLEAWTIPAPSRATIAARTQEVLLAAGRACDEMRAVHGNCAVSDIQFRISRHDSRKIHPQFTLAYFSPMQTSARAE